MCKAIVHSNYTYIATFCVYTSLQLIRNIQTDAFLQLPGTGKHGLQFCKTERACNDSKEDTLSLNYYIGNMHGEQ